MKKSKIYLIGLLFLSLLVLTSTTFYEKAEGSSPTGENNISIIPNVRTIKVNSRIQKEKIVSSVKDGKLYIPVERIATRFGAKVSSKKGQEPKVTITYNNKRTEFWVHQKEIHTNGQLTSTSLDAFVKKGYVYIPLHIAAEALGQSAYWGRTGVGVIGTKDYVDHYKKQTTPTIPIIMFHHLAYGTKTPLIMNPDEFAQQMGMIDHAGYTTLTSEELVSISKGDKKMPKRPLMITFDDGYRSNYEYAYPVLKKYNMKATVFIITDFIEHPERHPSPFPKMSWDEMREMSASGLISFQSHTDNLHNKLPNGKGVMVAPIEVNGKMETTKQYRKRVYDDLVHSKQILEARLGKPVTTFAYPFGHWSDMSEEMVKKAGFKMSVSTEFGIPSDNTSLYKLYRENVDGRLPAGYVMTAIEKEKVKN